MLKPVVEHDELRAVLRDGAPCAAHAVGVLHVRHVGQLLGQFQGLVVGAALGRAVAAADQRHAQPVGRGTSAPATRRRRLAGSAERDVADADDRHVDALDRGAAGVITTISPANGGRIGDFEHAKRGAQQGRADPAAAAADELSKFGRAKQDVAIRSSEHACRSRHAPPAELTPSRRLQSLAATPACRLYASRLQIASAISRVPTAVGSLRSGFKS